MGEQSRGRGTGNILELFWQAPSRRAVKPHEISKICSSTSKMQKFTALEKCVVVNLYGFSTGADEKTLKND